MWGRGHRMRFCSVSAGGAVPRGGRWAGRWRAGCWLGVDAPVPGRSHVPREPLLLIGCDS